MDFKKKITCIYNVSTSFNKILPAKQRLCKNKTISDKANFILFHSNSITIQAFYFQSVVSHRNEYL